jgi:molybdopterin adenylyltransferase
LIKVGIITASDKSAAGAREDQSGPLIRRMLEPLAADIVEAAVLPDEQAEIESKLREMSDCLEIDLILTTGGTGLGPRDVTPDATLAVIDTPVPGLPEAMRQVSLAKTPHAMLSRAAAGIRGRTLIVNLPGSPRAVGECLKVILPAIPHAIEVLRGKADECARLRDSAPDENWIDRPGSGLV